MLMPAAAMVIVVLASIAIDSAAVYMQQRELYNAADAAANDAATYGVDLEYLRASGEIRLDPDRVRMVVEASLAAQRLPLTAAPAIELVDARIVQVELQRSVDHVIARLRPAVAVTVRATARARDPQVDPP